MRRRRRVVGPETAECSVCGETRTGVRYQSWLPAGRISRRRVDVRDRWQCDVCGCRTDVTAAAGRSAGGRSA